MAHLACSALVAVAAAVLLFLLWYPWPYSVLAGGMSLFMLICGVDVVIGPLITLIIFDTRKPWLELRRDLLVVVMLLALVAIADIYVRMFPAPAA